MLTQNLENAIHHAIHHIFHSTFRPSPRDGRTDPSLHPGKVHLGTDEVRASGFEEDGFTPSRQYGIANEDVIFPVSLERTREITNVCSVVNDQCPQIVDFHLLLGSGESVLTESFKIDPLLPIRTCQRVDPPSVILMGFANK
jgi:hypothetical protein